MKKLLKIVLGRMGVPFFTSTAFFAMLLITMDLGDGDGLDTDATELSAWGGVVAFSAAFSIVWVIARGNLRRTIESKDEGLAKYFFPWIFIVSGAIAISSVFTGDEFEIFFGSGQSWVVIFVLSLFASTGWASVWKSFTKFDKREFYKNTPHPAAVESVIHQLRARSRILRMTSMLVVMSMALTIVIAATIFSRAKESASQGAEDWVGPDLAYRLDELQDRRSVLVVKIGNIERRARAANQVGRGDMDPNDELAIQLDEYHLTLDTVEKNIAELKIVAASLKPSDPPEKSDALIWQETIIALSTKFGIALLLLFLVQIFVQIYKYSLRLAAFYDARGDCLQCSEADSPEDLKKFLEVFSAESLDFGKIPRSPGDRAIHAAGEALKSSKSNGG